MLKTSLKDKVKTNLETEKKENIYIIMWPEDKLVLKRIIKVKGRMI